MDNFIFIRLASVNITSQVDKSSYWFHSTQRL